MSDTSPLSRADLIGLHKTAVDELYKIEEMAARTHNLSLYSTIGIVGFAAATLKSKLDYDHVAIGAFGMTFLAVALFTYYSLTSIYRRAMETIAYRAKIEECIGLTDATSTVLSQYWQGEALIGRRYIDARRRAQSSEDFIESALTSGFIVRARFVVPAITGILGIVAIALAIAR